MAKYPGTSLSVVIPAYNEEENIAWVVEDTMQTLPEYFDDFEIIVVDDGSDDKTAMICDDLCKRYDRLRVIHKKNSGFSRALRDGIDAARKVFIAYEPADGQFTVRDMRHCFEVMQENDMVLGYRGGRPDYTQWRMMMSHGYLMLLILLFGIRYMDVGWVTIWRADKVKTLDLSGTGGVFILAETLVRSMRKGYRIGEAPSFYHVRKFGTVKNAKMSIVLKTFGNALKLWFQMKLGRDL